MRDQLTIYYITCEEAGAVYASSDYTEVVERRDSIEQFAHCQHPHAVRNRVVRLP